MSQSQDDFAQEYNIYGIKNVSLPYNNAPLGSTGAFPDTVDNAVNPQAIQAGFITGDLNSANFKTGSTGWQIKANGDVEFGSGKFRGDITGATGTFSGTVNVGSLNIPDSTTANSFHVDTAGNAWWGTNVANFNANNDNALAYVLKTGVAKFQSATISGTSTVGIGNVPLAARGWTQTSAFTFTGANQVNWGAGTFTSADGTSYSIGAGNTGAMAARTYIYLDTAVSSTAYQVTTTATTAVGSTKVLIATAINGSVEPTFTVFGGLGGQNIDASTIVANSITANELSTSITYAGSIIIDTTGLIRSGQTAYNTGTGWFLGNVAGTPKFSIGNPSTFFLTWDGTMLTINDSNTLVSFTAGENISAAEAVFLAISSPADAAIINQTSTDATQSFGRTSSFLPIKSAQSISFTPRDRLTKITLKLRKFSSPTDNVRVSIQADSGGSPSGTILTSGTVAGSSLTTSYADYTFTLGSDFEAASGTTYWIVVDRDGSLDDTNFYGISGNSTSAYSGGSAKDYNGTSWGTASFADFYFIVKKSFTNNNLYRTSALSSSYNDFTGFAYVAITSGASGYVKIAGAATGFSGLTVGNKYFLSDTWGAVATSAGTTSVKIGRATSATSIQLIYTI